MLPLVFNANIVRNHHFASGGRSNHPAAVCEGLAVTSARAASYWRDARGMVDAEGNTGTT